MPPTPKGKLHGVMRPEVPILLFHGTVRSEVPGFASGRTEGNLFLTTSMENAEEYANARWKSDGSNAEDGPIILTFALEALERSMDARTGLLEADWNWLPRRKSRQEVSWRAGLKHTGHVVFTGDFSTARVPTVAFDTQIAAHNKKGQANQPTQNIQKRIVARAREIQQTHFPESIKTTGSCLYATWAVIMAAGEHDIKLRLFAGSAKWRCMDDAHDDGVSAQWFAYQWDPGPHTLQIGTTKLSGLSRANATQLIHNQMPEMHVWAGDGNVIVDITTGNWPAQTKAIINRPWLAPRPPDFWWDTAATLPLGASYEYNTDAMRTAIYLLNPH